MVDDTDFRAGFIEGYRAVMGKSAATPMIPMQPATRSGQTPFRMGVRKGIKKGCDRKGVSPEDF